MADVPLNPKIRRRRIIERPRLVAALDRSRARVRMLVAPAGYGKTTLAEQWAGRDGMRVAWIRARRSAADIAVLARALAAAGAEIVPGSDRRLRERLNATLDPAGDVTVLAEMLAEDLQSWPEDAWIAIDDYHHACESATCESFVETLVQRTPVRLLLATRQRPAWVSTRSILYGEVLEIGQSALAMREDEVDEVLAGTRDGMSSGLVALAGGWPAVIGLASLTTSPVDTEAAMPDELYEFFAAEIYRNLDPVVRAGLGLLAVAPSLDRDLACEILTERVSRKVCAEALSLGLMEEREGRLELHPLAIAFLEVRMMRDSRVDVSAAVRTITRAYRARGDWDGAFDLVERYSQADELQELLGEATTELLNGGRIATLLTWVEQATALGLSNATVLMARSEVALRMGQNMSAQSLAEQVLGQLGDDESCDPFRALTLAARAAHAGSREEAALSLYVRAADMAESPAARREALMGELMCSSALELPSSHELLRQLEESMPSPADAFELVRMADKRLGLGFRFGYIHDLAQARSVAELVAQVDDPFARCSFRCALSCALNLSSYYDEALHHASELLEEALDLRIDPALPYGHTMVAAALSGQRDFDGAHGQLDKAGQQARRCSDHFGEQSVYASRVRVLLQEGRFADASGIEPPDLARALPSMRGEVLGSRGLLLASLGRLEEARAVAQLARTATKGIEATTLVAGIDAVCTVNERRSGQVSAAERFLEVAFRTGAIDIAVTAYRANHGLLELLLTAPGCRERMTYIVMRAGDEGLASSFGPTGARLDPHEDLSKREREVYELACVGLSNGEIAKRLFIAETTVKVHMHHIFDKLGIRSRTALALNAARKRG